MGCSLQENIFMNSPSKVKIADLFLLYGTLKELLIEHEANWNNITQKELFDLVTSKCKKKINPSTIQREIELLDTFQLPRNVEDQREEWNEVETEIPIKLRRKIEYGDLMSRKEFILNCECGGLNDDDGSGSLSDGLSVHKSHRIHPSDVNAAYEWPVWATHVVWYNK